MLEFNIPDIYILTLVILLVVFFGILVTIVVPLFLTVTRILKIITLVQSLIIVINRIIGDRKKKGTIDLSESEYTVMDEELSDARLRDA
ncbi:MAG: hypothetical protein ABIH11_03840 [Candidatus Altiarchaeota archaeon]